MNSVAKIEEPHAKKERKATELNPYLMPYIEVNSKLKT